MKASVRYARNKLIPPLLSPFPIVRVCFYDRKIVTRRTRVGVKFYRRTRSDSRANFSSPKMRVNILCSNEQTLRISDFDW